MTCCSIITQPFLAETVTTVGYTGNRPTVQVAYLQPDGSLLVAGVMTQIDINGGFVTVDHGGVASGFLIIKQ